MSFGSSTIIRLASTLILTRMLFPEVFGLLTLVSSFIVGLVMLSDIGISRADIPAVVAAVGVVGADGQEFDPIASIRVWNRSRDTARTLAAMDDRQLNDIGFVRGDIDWVAEELAIRSLVPANHDAAPKAA